MSGGRKRIIVRLSDLQNRDSEGGIRCRKCGCRDFRVIYTKKATLGRIRRRRQCRHCSHRITTYEAEAGGP